MQQHKPNTHSNRASNTNSNRAWKRVRLAQMAEPNRATRRAPKREAFAAAQVSAS